MNELFLLTWSLRGAGIGLIILALLHRKIERELQWREDSCRMSPVNAQIFRVHSLFIILVLGMQGTLCLFGTYTLLQPTSLGLWVAIGFFLFWMIRLYCQWFVYSKTLWLGKKRETLVHRIATTTWLALVILFAWLLKHQFSGRVTG